MYQRGLTLIELLATVTILAILLHLAMPSFRQLINSNRQHVVANELLSALRSARTAAITRQSPVIIQPLEDNWAFGWRMIADASGKGLSDPDNPVLVVRQNSGKVRVVPNARLAGWVRFNSLGTPAYAGASPGNGSLYICDDDAGKMYTRVVVAAVGRIRLDDRPGDSGDLCASTYGLDT
jgi:type IV fimbrial biogenesis protein FimT